MTKTSVKLFIALSIAGYGGIVCAVYEFRSPLSVYRGPTYYPYPAQDDGEFVIENWDALYCRSADKAYVPNDCSASVPCSTGCSKGCCTSISLNCCDSGKSTRHTEPLSILFFGKSIFRGEEAFANGMLDSAQMAKGYPALSFSKLAPRVDYNERGAVLGINAYKKFGDERTLRVGLRASLPIKVIEVTRYTDCALAETLDDVIKTAVVEVRTPESTIYQTYAYRLDFLSSLAFPTPGGGSPLVHYGNGSHNTTIAGINVDTVQYPIFAKRSNSGAAPETLYHKDTSDGQLAADGSGGSDGQFLNFAYPLNYAGGLGIDRAAQGKLYVVPSDEGLTNGEARTIDLAVQTILNMLDYTGKESAEYFFNSKCIYFTHRRVSGAGDLNTELYAGYHPEDDWYADLIVGVRFPTGTKYEDPGELFYVPTGNNKHYEIKGGLEGGFNPVHWFAIRGYLAGSHVFKHAEKRAVPFKGAKVRNIGPSMDVEISYNYLQGNIDLNFFHPEHREFGCTIGYEIFARGKDKACCATCACDDGGCNPCGVQCPKADFANNQATDPLGFRRDVDCSLFECGSNAMSHKIRGEVFHRFECGYVELFGGASYVIGGRYTMKETEAHIGIDVNF